MKQISEEEKELLQEEEEKEIDELKGLEEIIELVEGTAWRGIKGNKYIVVEPPPPDKEIIEKAKEYVLSRLSFEDLDKLQKLYEEGAKRALKEFKKKFDDKILKSTIYYLRRDIEGLGKLDPIMKDPYVEDVTLPARGGRKLFVYLAGKGEWLETNIELNEEEARQIVLKLAERVGKQVSLAVPRLEGKLPDGSRVHALYGPAVSEGGTTFCLAEGYVALGDGRIVDIKELYEREAKDSIEGENALDLDLPVLEADECLDGIIMGKAGKIVSFVPKEKLVEITFREGLRHNLKVKVTKDHLFHVVEKDAVRLIPASKLRPGMWIVVPSRLPYHDDASIENEYAYRLIDALREMDSEYKRVFVVLEGRLREIASSYYSKLDSTERREFRATRYGIIRLSKFLEMLEAEGIDPLELKRIKVKNYKERAVSIPLRLTEEFCYLLGLIFSNGHLSMNRVDISLFSNSLANFVVKILREEMDHDIRSYHGGNRIHIIGSVLPFVLNKVFGTPVEEKAEKISVPLILQRRGGKPLLAFIRGLFDGDGTFFSNMAVFKSSSKKLLDQLQFLLLRYGIYSIRNGDNTLAIPAPYLPRFLKVVSPLKKPNSLKIADGEVCNKLPSLIIDAIDEVLRDQGISHNKVEREAGVSLYDQKRLGRLTFGAARRIVKYLGKLGINHPTLDYLKWLIQGDKEYLEIVSVVETDSERVYDLVCNPHPFFIGGTRPMYIHDTIRKFVVRPTIEQLISWGSVSVEAAAYLWLLAEHGVSGFIAGETGSGKTTFLNALLSLLSKYAHIVTVEDSVTGDCEIIFVKDGRALRGKIGELIDEELRKRGMEEGALFVRDSDIKVYAIDECGRVILAPVTMFYKHKVFKDIYEIKTSTGRTIRTTGDHSLFTVNGEGKLVPVEVRNISVGDYIVVPRYLPPVGSMSSKEIDLLSERYIGCLLQLQEEIRRKLYVMGPGIRQVLKSLPKDLRLKFDKTDRNRKDVLLLSEFVKVSEEVKSQEGDLYIGTKNSGAIPSKIPLNESFMEFFGLWLASGSYGTDRSVIISCKDAKCVQDVSRHLQMKARVHSDGKSLILNSAIFGTIMEHILGFYGDICTRRVPEWIFSLNERQISAFLRGYFSGDGDVRRHEIESRSASYNLLKDIQMLLLRLGIVSRVKEMRKKDGYGEDPIRYKISISDRRDLSIFRSKVGFLQEEKNRKLSISLFLEDISGETLPIDMEELSRKSNLNEEQEQSFVRSYINRTGRVSKPKKGILMTNGGNVHLQRGKEVERIESDLYLDRVVSIKKIDDGKEGLFVYDLTVGDYENFICEGIVAHNTPEIYLPDHKNWTSLIGQPPGMGVKGMEIPDLLRDVLRMRPDYVVVGESRGAEVRLLVQFIHIGHTSFCLPRDEPVLVEVDGEVKFEKIGEIVEQAIRGEIRDIKVPALSREGRVVWAPARSVIRKEGPKEFVEIEARGAPTFRASIGHPVYVIRNGKPLLIPAGEVRPGDKIPVAGDIPAKISKREIYVTDLLKSEDKSIYIRGASSLLNELKPSQLSKLAGRKVTNSNIFDWRRRGKAFPLDIYEAVDPEGHYKRGIEVMSCSKAKCSIPNRIPLNFDFGYIIGLFLADGSASYLKNGLRISLNPRKDKKIADKFRRSVKKVFGLETKCYRMEKSLELVVHAAILGKVFKALGLELRDSERRVPDLAFEAPKEFRLGILVGYIEGDGHIRRHGKNSYMVVAHSSSRELAYSLAYLCRTIGIDVSVKERDNSRSYAGSGRIYIIRVLGGEGLVKLSKALNLQEPTVVSKKPVYLAKVTSIRFLSLDSPLYDFEVPGYGNFVHSGGTITSNTTFHASTIEGVIARLKGDPINLTDEQIADFKVAALLRKEGEFRGVVRIAELRYDQQSKKVVLNDIFKRLKGKELIGNPTKNSGVFMEIAAKEGVPRIFIVKEYLDKIDQLRKRVESVREVVS